MKRVLKSSATILVLLSFFGWGVLTHRNEIFPYRLFKKLSLLFHLIEPGEESIQSQSPAFDMGVLASLPYVDGTYDPKHEKRGVIIHDPQKAFPGYSFYIADHTAYLIDMNGEPIHVWRNSEFPIDHSELLPDGHIIASAGEMLAKLDVEARIVWALEPGAHHEFSIAGNGDIYLLAKKEEAIPEVHPQKLSVVDYVTIVSPAGIKKRETSIAKMLLESRYRYLMPSLGHLPLRKAAYGRVLDVFHSNYIEVFDGAAASESHLFAKGNILISVRNLNAIAIADGESHEILWLWGPSNLTFQHYPRLLENGRILVFNNGLGKSQVIEIDPLTMMTTWRYAPLEGFHSPTKGSNERLPNGNTLIAESDKGYALEITRDHETVWKFANPIVDEEGVRSGIVKIERFSPSQLPFLASARRQ